MNQVRALLQRPAFPWIALCLSQVIFVTVVLTSNLEKSLTFDEAFHITSGHTHWTYNDYRLTPDNGNLAKRWIALPLVFQSLKFPDKDNIQWSQSNQVDVSRDFVFHPENDSDQIVWSGRVMMALAGVALCLTIFFLSRHFFGLSGAWVSLLACMFSPTILAHSRLMTSDLITSMTFLWSLAALWHVLHKLTWTSLTLSALATTAVILSKFSGMIVIFLALILAVFRVAAGREWLVSLKRGKAAQTVTSRRRQALLVGAVVLWHLVLGLFFIWMAYGFRYSMFYKPSPSNHPPKGLDVNLNNLGSLGPVVGTLKNFRLAPESFIFGVSSVLGFSEGRRGYMNGEVSQKGWRTYFPFTFLVKTSWPILILILLALSRGLSGPAPPGKSRASGLFESFYKFAPYLIFIAVYSVLAIRSSLNIGHRHILPIYPPILLLLGSLGAWLSTKPIWKRGLLYGLGLALVIECCWIYPHYLSYFNGLIRPKNAYHHLVDSNLDWGQDLPTLKKWLDKEAVNDSSSAKGDIVISYFGFAKPSYYGVKARDVAGYHTKNGVSVPRPWKAGYFCVSASVFKTVYSGAPGPWTPEYERNYQRIKGEMALFWKAEKLGKDRELVSKNRTRWVKCFFGYEHFSVARLCAYLKDREPTARIAYSILVFQLSPKDIEAAFDGPAPFESEK